MPPPCASPHGLADSPLRKHILVPQPPVSLGLLQSWAGNRLYQCLPSLPITGSPSVIWTQTKPCKSDRLLMGNGIGLLQIPAGLEVMNDWHFSLTAQCHSLGHITILHQNVNSSTKTSLQNDSLKLTATIDQSHGC